MNLGDIFKKFYSKKDKEWYSISDEDKELSFFIFNRYLSKKYVDKAQFFNSNKEFIDKALCMDIWYEFMKTQPYPSWFWSKPKSSEKSKITNKEFISLQKHLQMKDIDLKYLIDNYFDFVKEELKYLKKLEKQN